MPPEIIGERFLQTSFFLLTVHQIVYDSCMHIQRFERFIHYDWLNENRTRDTIVSYTRLIRSPNRICDTA